MNIYILLDCGGKTADIMFLLDSSSSILYKDFIKELNFTKNVVKLFDIGEDKTRVGLISFRFDITPIDFILHDKGIVYISLS